MASQGKKLEKKIVEDVEKCFEEMYGHADRELVEVEYRRESSGWVLRVYIDKEGGVLLDDCSMTSSQLGDIIEVKDIMNGANRGEGKETGGKRKRKKEEEGRRGRGESI